MNKKTIFHIDFDSYFVSAHRKIDKSLLGKPIAISKNTSRSIASTVSYELRKLGIKAGMPVFQIKNVCPNTIFIKPNFELYINLSNQIFDYIANNFSKNIEIGSIDECWLDVTNSLEKNKISAKELAIKIQNRINKIFSIPISIGISHNKFLAKMGSDLAKPFGIFILDNKNIETKLWPLNVSQFYGIGNSLSVKLKKDNIQTIKDLAFLDPNSMVAKKLLGKNAYLYITKAKGISNDDHLEFNNELKSIGNELTFHLEDLVEYDDIYKIIKQLTIKICHRAQNRMMVGKTIVIRIKNLNNKWMSKQQKINEPTNDENIVLNYVLQLFNQTWDHSQVRGIGVYLHNLFDQVEFDKQLSIFKDYTNKYNFRVDKIISDVNKKFQKRILKTAESLQNEAKKELIIKQYIPKDDK